MFGRNKTPEAMDEALPFMTASDASELRSRAARQFAAAGKPVSVLGDRLVAADGQEYGLWNLAASCHAAERGRRDWDQFIAKHVHTLLNPPPDPASLTDEQLFAAVHSRLFSAEMLSAGPEEMSSWGREIAEGVIELLVADFPDSIQSLTAEIVAARGGDDLWARGRAHTMASTVDDTAEIDAKDGARVTVLMGESFFFASRIVDLRPLLDEVYGTREYPHGVVVGMPHRHQVVLHPLDDPRSIAAIGVAAQFTARSNAESAGSISPMLYWWDGTRFHTVSKVEDTGKVGIIADGPFLDALNALAATG